MSKLKDLLNLGLCVGDKIAYKHSSGLRVEPIGDIRMEHTRNFAYSPYVVGEMVIRLDNIDLEKTKEANLGDKEEMIRQFELRRDGFNSTKRKLAKLMASDFSLGESFAWFQKYEDGSFSTVEEEPSDDYLNFYWRIFETILHYQRITFVGENVYDSSVCKNFKIFLREFGQEITFRHLNSMDGDTALALAGIIVEEKIEGEVS